MGILDKLFDPGKKSREAADRAAKEARVVGGEATGPGGIKAGFSFQDGRGTQTSDLGVFDPIMQNLLARSQASFGQGAALSPELQQLFGGAVRDLATPNLQPGDFSQQQAGLSQLFGSQLGTATADPFALGAGVTERLNALAARPERQLVNKKFQQLFGSGRLGASAGIEEAYQMQDQLERAGIQRDLAGLQAGQSLQQNALGALFGAGQQLSDIQSQLFGQRLSGQQLLSQFANQRFGMGTEAQRLLNQIQQQGFTQGLAGIQGATSLVTLPLAFQQALLQAQGLKSNVDLGVASNFQQSAANAKSPFVEALNTIGTFMGNIKPGGV